MCVLPVTGGGNGYVTEHADDMANDDIRDIARNNEANTFENAVNVCEASPADDKTSGERPDSEDSSYDDDMMMHICW